MNNTQVVLNHSLLKKSEKVNLTTRFLNGKILVFSEFSIKCFVYDLIEMKKIYEIYKINRCYLYQNLTDADSTSVFFVFICDLNSVVLEKLKQDI